MSGFGKQGLAKMLALAVALMAGAQANAAQFLYTVSGVVVGEELTYDEWGVFNPQQGQAFTAEFVVNDASPLALYSYGTTGSSASGGGQVQLGTRTPVSAKLTIGSSSYVIQKGDFHQYPTVDSVGDPVGPTDLIDERGGIQKDASAGQLDIGAGYSWSHSCCWPHPNDSYGQGELLDFTLTSAAFSDPDYRQLGTFAVSGGGYFGKYETIVAWPGQLTQILLGATTLTVSQVSAVPETATWLMMIVGIGAVGLALRRRGAKVISPLAA